MRMSLSDKLVIKLSKDTSREEAEMAAHLASFMLTYSTIEQVEEQARDLMLMGYDALKRVYERMELEYSKPNYGKEEKK